MQTRSAFAIASAAVLASLLIGCAHEKNTDYRARDFHSRRALREHARANGNDLSDSDVLGTTSKDLSDEEIRKALDRAGKVELRRGETVLVVQSGQTVPDADLIKRLNDAYRIVPYSGIRSDWPLGDASNAPDYYARALRLAAAQAGAEKILCFWGTLEVAQHDLATKTITWLPVVDIVVPDQKDHVRVHLKTAVIDVRSGAWTVFRTEPMENDVVSTGWAREHVEPYQLRTLKQHSYEAAVATLTAGK